MKDNFKMYAVRNKVTGEWFQGMTTPMFTGYFCRASLHSKIKDVQGEINFLKNFDYKHKNKIAERDAAVRDMEIVELDIKVTPKGDLQKMKSSWWISTI